MHGGFSSATMQYLCVSRYIVHCEIALFRGPRANTTTAILFREYEGNAVRELLLDDCDDLHRQMRDLIAS